MRQTYLFNTTRKLLHKPDGNGLVWRHVNHGLSGQESVDFSLRAELGTKILLVDLYKLGLT